MRHMGPKFSFIYRSQRTVGLTKALFWLCFAALLMYLVWQNPVAPPKHAICAPNQCFAINLLFCVVPLAIGLQELLSMWTRGKAQNWIEITDTSVSAPVVGKAGSFAQMDFADINRVERCRNGSDLQGKLVIHGPSQKLEILSDRLEDVSKFKQIHKLLRQANTLPTQA